MFTDSSHAAHLDSCEHDTELFIEIDLAKLERTGDKSLDIDVVVMRGISAIFAIVLMVCLAFGILTDLSAMTRIKRLKKNIYRYFAIGIFRTRWSKSDFFPVCVTNVRELWVTRLSSLS
jgi:hypothetical protein